MCAGSARWVWGGDTHTSTHDATPHRTVRPHPPTPHTCACVRPRARVNAPRGACLSCAPTPASPSQASSSRNPENTKPPTPAKPCHAPPGPTQDDPPLAVKEDSFPEEDPQAVPGPSFPGSVSSAGLPWSPGSGPGSNPWPPWSHGPPPGVPMPAGGPSEQGNSSSGGASGSSGVGPPAAPAGAQGGGVTPGVGGGMAGAPAGAAVGGVGPGGLPWHQPGFESAARREHASERMALAAQHQEEENERLLLMVRNCVAVSPVLNCIPGCYYRCIGCS